MFTTRITLFRPETIGMFVKQKLRNAPFHPFATVFDMGEGDRIIGIAYSISDEVVNEVNSRIKELLNVKYGRSKKIKCFDGKIRKKWIEVTKVHTPVLAIHYEITNGKERYVGISVCAKEEPSIDIKKGISYARKRALKPFIEEKGWVVAMIDGIIEGDVDNELRKVKSRRGVTVVELQEKKDEYEKNEKNLGIDFAEGDSHSVTALYDVDEKGDLKVVDIEGEGTV